MSLINDALKRAKESERNDPSHATISAGMEPVDTSRRSTLIAVIALLSVLVVLMGAWCVFQWMAYHGTPAPAAAPASPPQTTPAPLPAQTAAPAPNPSPSPTQALPTPPTAPPVVSAPSNGVNPPPPSAPPAPTPAPTVDTSSAPPPVETTTPFPDLKLQAIFYGHSNPMAMINGQTVGEGEDVNGARVKKIEANKVTVEMNRMTKELFLNGQ